MTKIVVRLPEPKREYSEDNQRQINRALSSMIQQLNSTYLQPDKDDTERFNFYITNGYNEYY
jgi:hypothetical protein